MIKKNDEHIRHNAVSLPLTVVAGTVSSTLTSSLGTSVAAAVSGAATVSTAGAASSVGLISVGAGAATGVSTGADIMEMSVAVRRASESVSHEQTRWQQEERWSRGLGMAKAGHSQRVLREIGGAVLLARRQQVEMEGEERGIE